MTFVRGFPFHIKSHKSLKLHLYQLTPIIKLINVIYSIIQSSPVILYLLYLQVSDIKHVSAETSASSVQIL